MKITLSLIFFMLFSLTANAETIYVTDSLKFNLRSAENSKSRILTVLNSGAPLKVIQHRKTGYSKVRTADGIVGYILTRYTLEQPTSGVSLEAANKKLARLETENKQIKTELATLKGDNSKNNAENQSLTEKSDKLSKELQELRQTSANAIQIKNQRDQLQERVNVVVNELEQIRLEKNALEESTNQDWFLYGGILAFFGIALGLLIPKFSWQRNTRRWDSL